MNIVPLWFVYLLICNTLLVLVYAIWNILRRREKSRSWIIRSCVMLLCPVVGVVFFLISWLLFRLVFRREVDLSDVVFSKDRVETATKANEELERNFVPLEEAIAVTDRRNLRELMMNIVRGNYQDSLSSIALALNSEDSETSHYAASVLQGALNDFRVDVQKDYQAVMEALENPDREKDPEGMNEQRAAMLIEFMDEMLQKRVFTDLEQKHYTHLMDEVAEKLYTGSYLTMDSGMLEEIALRLLEIQDYELCEKWCLRIATLYPETLCAYTTRLKLYFSNGEKSKFFAVLDQLKHSDVIVDRETLDLIRAFT